MRAILFLLQMMTAAIAVLAFHGAAPGGGNTPSSSSSKKKTSFYIPCMPLKDLPPPGHAISTRITSTTSTSETPDDGSFVSRSTMSISICIAVDHKGFVYALSNECPPMNFPLSDGTLHMEDGTISDPMLGTKFSLVTGQVVGPWCPTILPTTSATGEGGGFFAKFLGGLFLSPPSTTSRSTTRHGTFSSSPTTTTTPTTNGVQTYPIRARNGIIEIEILANP